MLEKYEIGPFVIHDAKHALPGSGQDNDYYWCTFITEASHTQRIIQLNLAPFSKDDASYPVHALLTYQDIRPTQLNAFEPEKKLFFSFIITENLTLLRARPVSPPADLNPFPFIERFSHGGWVTPRERTRTQAILKTPDYRELSNKIESEPIERQYNAYFKQNPWLTAREVEPVLTNNLFTYNGFYTALMQLKTSTHSATEYCLALIVTIGDNEAKTQAQAQLENYEALRENIEGIRHFLAAAEHFCATRQALYQELQAYQSSTIELPVAPLTEDRLLLSAPPTAVVYTTNPYQTVGILLDLLQAPAQKAEWLTISHYQSNQLQQLAYTRDLINQLLQKKISLLDIYDSTRDIFTQDYPTVDFQKRLLFLSIYLELAQRKYLKKAITLLLDKFCTTKPLLPTEIPNFSAYILSSQDFATVVRSIPNLIDRCTLLQHYPFNTIGHMHIKTATDISIICSSLACIEKKLFFTRLLEEGQSILFTSSHDVIMVLSAFHAPEQTVLMKACAKEFAQYVRNEEDLKLFLRSRLGVNNFNILLSHMPQETIERLTQSPVALRSLVTDIPSNPVSYRRKLAEFFKLQSDSARIRPLELMIESQDTQALKALTETNRSLFETYWTSIPANDRSRLYPYIPTLPLFSLSLSFWAQARPSSTDEADDNKANRAKRPRREHESSI